ncbi:hypothetical protein BDZ97DRAFT_1904240 [Flammula alnicola]|nr:hypothetical protein BDZ97DRAFT_1904240 [Flammula alnicola]
MPQPLPPNPYNTGQQAVLHAAYKRCVILQNSHLEVVQCGRLSVLICARLLGYMILEAPIDEGRTEFVSEIVRCVNDVDLQKLAEVYKNHLLRLFRRIKGHTPTPSRHPSAPSFDTQAAGFSLLLAPTPGSHGSAKEQALERDGYRCVFSGRLDSRSVDEGRVQEDDESVTTVTELAHIFDRSTNEGLEDEKKASYASSALAVLSRFGRIDAVRELNGAGLHRLENVLTLASDLHQMFDKLQLWLERKPDVIVFSGTLPPPDPRYLALHAACARVAHLSGAGEYIDRILRDIERVGVLASHGNSDALYHVLVCRVDVEIEAY